MQGLKPVSPVKNSAALFKLSSTVAQPSRGQIPGSRAGGKRGQKPRLIVKLTAGGGVESWTVRNLCAQFRD